MHEDLILACPRCGGSGVIPGAFLMDTICVLCDGTGEVYEESVEEEDDNSD